MDEVIKALRGRPDLRHTVLAEAKHVRATCDFVRGNSLGKLPLAVVTAGRRDGLLHSMYPVWLELQHRLAELSSVSSFVVAKQSGHFVQVEQPDVVVEAIRWILDVARSE
jgi:pimeloyl-ACP methyl ester carboxylesterase